MIVEEAIVAVEMTEVDAETTATTATTATIATTATTTTITATTTIKKTIVQEEGQEMAKTERIVANVKETEAAGKRPETNHRRVETRPTFRPKSSAFIAVTTTTLPTVLRFPQKRKTGTLLAI